MLELCHVRKLTYIHYIVFNAWITFWQDTKIALDGIEMLQHMTEKQLDYVFKVGVNLESIVLYM